MVPNPPNAIPRDQLTEVHVRGRKLECLVCGHDGFLRREVAMNTSGMTFVGLDWANKSADGAVCRQCGFVHAFLSNQLEWLRAALVEDEP